MKSEEWFADVRISDLSKPQREIAEVIGIEATLRLCQVYGGSTTYIPKNDAVYKTVVQNREIRRRYLLGVKIRDLQSQYGLSDRSVQRIVEGCAPSQVSLFDST